MRTAVVSDLHLGALRGTDLASVPAHRRRLLEALEGADRVVLLGDLIEERERPRGRAARASPGPSSTSWHRSRRAGG